MCERSILLHVRCSNCLTMYQQNVPVPADADAPGDGDELVQSAFVREMRFECPKCEAVYAEIVAFKVKEMENAA